MDYRAVSIVSLLRACTLLFSLCITTITNAEPSLKVGVLYPDVREPYQSVFREITEGISEHDEFITLKRALSSDDDQDIVQEWVQHHDIDIVIALGNRSKRLVSPIREEKPTFLGAILLSRDLVDSNWSGIVLNPHPVQLFQHLQHFSPDIKNVHVAFVIKNNKWLIELADTTAQNMGLNLVPHPVTDIKDSAHQFRKIIEMANPKTDAIWILQNPSIVDKSTILPFILKESWKRSLVVFSSSPEHVKRGALFSVFPDHKNIGRQLGVMINESADNDFVSEAILVPVKDTKFVANIRTFEHLGIDLSKEDEELIDIVFPSR